MLKAILCLIFFCVFCAKSEVLVCCILRISFFWVGGQCLANWRGQGTCHNFRWPKLNDRRGPSDFWRQKLAKIFSHKKGAKAGFRDCQMARDQQFWGPRGPSFDCGNHPWWSCLHIEMAHSGNTSQVKSYTCILSCLLPSNLFIRFVYNCVHHFFLLVASTRGKKVRDTMRLTRNEPLS